MDQGEGEADRDAGEARRRAPRGGADDDEQEEEGRQDFRQQARRQPIFAGAQIAS